MNQTHFANLVPEQAWRLGHKTALRYKDPVEKRWMEVSWLAFDADVRRTAVALAGLGIKVGDRVGLFSPNRAECLVVDFALYSIRAVGVPLYATSTTAQIKYILKDAGVNLLFVGGQYQYDRAIEAMGLGCGLTQLVAFDTGVRLAMSDEQTLYFKDFLQQGYDSQLEDEVADRRAQASFTDLANILYTSGTSGEPKGVLITHAMYQEALRTNHLRLKHLSDDEVSLCFLPMTHIFEKAWDLYCLARGFRIDINEHPMDIQEVLKEVRPTVMCSVPRFWEKVHAGILQTVGNMPPLVTVYFNRALQVGKRYHLDYKRNGLRPPFWTIIGYTLYKHTLFKVIERRVGLDRGVFFPVGGAAFSEDLCRFFRSMGIPTVHGYGLTESTATVSVFDNLYYEMATVGTVIDGLQVRIGENREIQLKGKTITPGYYNKPEETAAAFTPDGFFRTGDAGAFTDKGELVVIERIKDLFKTANGKYVAPQQLEMALTSDPAIDMAAIIGDDRPFVTALIVPNQAEIKKLANTLGLKQDKGADWLTDERLLAHFEARIRVAQKHMATYEQVRRFVLLATPFSMDNGELTNTLKMRRKVITEHYASIIETMYR